MSDWNLSDALEFGAGELQKLLAAAATAVVATLLLVVIAPLLLLHAVFAPTSGSDVPALPVPAAGPPPVVGDSPAVALARRYLGVPYLFGGTDPRIGVDCSALVQLVFHQLGISLPRTAQLQFNSTPRVTIDELRPGDLVFFARTYADPFDWITHVGIYIGNGQQINAPTTGEVVSIAPVLSGFWGAHYAGAGRVRGT